MSRSTFRTTGNSTRASRSTSASASITTAFLQTRSTPLLASASSGLPQKTIAPPSAAVSAFSTTKFPSTSPSFRTFPRKPSRNSPPRASRHPRANHLHPRHRHQTTAPFASPTASAPPSNSIANSAPISSSVSGYEHRQSYRQFFLNPVSAARHCTVFAAPCSNSATITQRRR